MAGRSQQIAGMTNHVCHCVQVPGVFAVIGVKNDNNKYKCNFDGIAVKLTACYDCGKINFYSLEVLKDLSETHNKEKPSDG